MAARQTGQSLRRQGGHASARGRRRERHESERRRIASVGMNLELTLCAACVADANLGRIRTELIVERQGGDGGYDARTTRQVDAAIDPAWVHDIDGQRCIRRARARSVAAIAGFQQQPDGIAA